MVVTIPSISALKPSEQLNQLDVQIGRDRRGHSFVRRQYATYPFRLSRSLRLAPTDLDRTYLYIMNSSPGLFAGDEFRLSVQLDDRTSLYLTDQSATKVHTMAADETAHIHYDITVGAGAQLEFVPEPIMLYQDASLEQTIQVKLDPSASLFLSEIVVPGRLARGELYHFHRYLSRLRVNTPTGALIFADAMHLAGRSHRFATSPIFAASPILASLILVLPGINLQPLSLVLKEFAHTGSNLSIASSLLPNCNGLLVRAMADRVPILKAYIHYSLAAMRAANGQPALPTIPK